ncbi:hypothetical protein ABID23_001581 [Bartonella silvatica]|uniref:Uncharacterized protein n=1 Tax=Bartonella silvatica TaxID=357760 RepID=A0ABV2HIV9_9HYPH
MRMSGAVVGRGKFAFGLCEWGVKPVRRGGGGSVSMCMGKNVRGERMGSV